MLIFCAVWLTFIPAYVSSPGKFTVAVEIFAILASSFGLIMCLFAPKCFIILCQPEKNTKKYLAGLKIIYCIILYKDCALIFVTFSINARNLRFSYTMIFAIEEINNSTELLPGINLGYQIHDSCAAVPVSGSTPSIAISRVIGSFDIPQVNTSFKYFQVSHIATCACLSDKQQYPNFFRTVPSDAFQAVALAKLVKHFGWTWIGAICSDSDYGCAALESCTFCLVCLFPIFIRHEYIYHLLRSTAKVIVAFTATGEMKVLFEELATKPSPSRQWIGSESWITDTNLLRFTFCEGAIGFAIPKSDIPGLRDFLLDLSPTEVESSPVLTEFWEETFKCTLKKGDLFSCKETFNNQAEVSNDFVHSSPLRITTLVYKAVYAIAHAIHTVVLTNFWVSVIVDSSDCFPCPIEFWPNAERDSCHPKPVEFLTIDETLAIILAAFSVGGACLAILTAAVFFHHRTTPIVRANNSELSFLLLFSLTLCFLCSLTFIGAPTEWSCMLRHSAFGITFVLCISCVLGKTIVVLMAFKATLPGSNVMKWFGPLQQRLTVVFVTFVQVIICTVWLVARPPFPMKNFSTYKEKILLECALGSAIGFWAVLGYIGLLAVFCFVLAVLARKLPDNFNEAKFITFSMLIFCAVWLTFIPAYVSSPGKFTVAVEIFAILASSFGLILCLFVPKCFIILCQPEKNTKKYLMNKK
uniref:G-protein coupled receptors family 3 profile domain-containing protein n=1 Tax=Oryzias melastigma TaxID=30732 RepID=A0A3B3D6N4_ORYME